jgi:hypothetical protein
VLVGSVLFRDLGRDKFHELEEYFFAEELRIGRKIFFQAPAEVNDDKFTIKWALHEDMPILTNDCYRDHIVENPDWEYDIRTRLVEFMFLSDVLVIAQWPDYRN